MDHFGAFAARYAAYRPLYPSALVPALRAETLGNTAWDVGCGNGQLSLDLAGVFERVIATDPAQAQLDQAPPHPRIEYRCASAEASGLPDASVDLVVAAQAAHWFDWPRFIGEVERVARSGALVALASYGNFEAPQDPAIDRYREQVAPYWPPGREHVDNGYRDLVLPWTPVHAPALAMTAAWTRDELVGYIATWSATFRLVQDQGPTALGELRDALATHWPDDERRQIRWPLAFHLARR
ncbi:MAG: class I SAM-dependent methyltransferase [Kofleriaceae bacterium]